MQLDLDTSGNIEILQRKLQENGGKIIAKKAIFLVMNKMETTAKEKISASVYSTPASPVYDRSGKAQQSIVGQQNSDLSAKVYMGVKYGKYIEEGTGIHRTPGARKPFWTTFGGLLDKPIFYKGMKPRPFWAPAIKETKKEIPKLIQKAFKQAKF